MKKQILIIVLLGMASFVGVSKSYGQQAVHVSDPKALPSCANDALHPMAGKMYDYIVTSAPATGAKFHWYATTNTSFIAGGILNNASTLTSPAIKPTTPAVYNSGSNTVGTLNMSWGTDVLAAAIASATTPVPTFVAVYVTGTTCADNLKVFQVEPVNAFMVDITNVENATLNSLAYTATENQCYANVQGASWASNAMTYNYGTNVLYYEVVASNFTGTWIPTFTIGGLQGGQTASIQWAYTTAFATPVTVATGVASTTAVTTEATDTSNGVSIFVKVTVANNAWEGLSNDVISLGVTGTNSAAQRDVLATDCTIADLASNTANQTLNLRSTISETTDNGIFE